MNRASLPFCPCKHASRLRLCQKSTQYLPSHTHCINHFIHIVIKSIEILPTGVDRSDSVEIRSRIEVQVELIMSPRDTIGSASTNLLEPDDLASVVHDKVTFIHILQNIQPKTSCSGEHNLGGLLRSQEKGAVGAPRVRWAIFPAQVVHRAIEAQKVSLPAA
jgi:hypothetical protein